MAQAKELSTNPKSSTPVEGEFDGAKKFLASNGFEDLIPVLVEKHKFQEIDDLKLMVKNSELVKTLDLPLCRMLKLHEQLNKEEDKKTRTNEAKKDISKKELLELCKEDLSAQAANHAWNKFNNIISTRVKTFHSENKWQGTGGLKICLGTSQEEGQSNLQFCNQILEDPELKMLFGVYNIKDRGFVNLDKLRAKKHIGNIMCSLRKPSAYGKQPPKQRSQNKKRPLREANNNKEKSKDSVPKKVQKVDTSVGKLKAKGDQPKLDDSGIIADDPDTEDNTSSNKTAKGDHPKLDDSGFVTEDLDAGDNTSNSKVISDYEKKRLKRIQENEVKMSMTGFVPLEQAVIVGLHLMKFKTITASVMAKLKVACKEHCVSFTKSYTKKDLLVSLGRAVFEKGIIKRIDESEVITHENLMYTAEQSDNN